MGAIPLPHVLTKRLCSLAVEPLHDKHILDRAFGVRKIALQQIMIALFLLPPVPDEPMFLSPPP